MGKLKISWKNIHPWEWVVNIRLYVNPGFLDFGFGLRTRLDKNKLVG